MRKVDPKKLWQVDEKRGIQRSYGKLMRKVDPKKLWQVDEKGGSKEVMAS